MTSDDIVRLSKKHTIFEWSPQETFDPLPVAKAKGVYFWTPEGKRFYEALGAEIGNMPAAEFGEFVKQELKRWEGIIALTGLPKQ